MKDEVEHAHRRQSDVPRTLRITFVVAVLSALFVGCGKSESSTGAAGPLEELKLGYFANATHAQAVLGVDSGDFARAIAPTKVSPKLFNAGPSLIEALFAHEVDIGYIGPGPALTAFARSNGEAIRVISGAAANGVVIVARKGSGIQSLKDLAGKRIATPQQGNTQDISARHYVMAVLGQKDTNNILPIANNEQSALMARGEIGASWAPEPWGARLVAENDATVVGEEKDLWPGREFSLTVVITTPEFLHDHPDVVQRVLEVHRAWTKRLNDDSAEVLPLLDDALFKLTQKRLPPGVLQAALPRVKFTDEPLEQTFSTMGQWAYDMGISRQPPRLEGLFDLTILRKLQQAPSPATSPGRSRLDAALQPASIH